MKTSNFSFKKLTVISILAALAATGAALSGCSSNPMKGGQSAKDISVTGPTVLNERAVPDKVDLGKTDKKMPEFLADVKDFNAPVTDVRLRFNHVPIDIPMENIGGTTWRAALSPKQVQDLAVSGETMNYEATIVATNSQGQTSTSEKPIQLSIKAPEVASSSSG